MSTQSKPKASEERFTYSWYLPVPGREGSGSAPPAEPEAAPLEEQQAESARATEAASRQPGGNEAKFRAFLGLLKASPSTLKIVGLASWSLIAGCGLIVLVTTQSPPPMGHVLALCGAWAALSALIWFVPGKLLK